MKAAIYARCTKQRYEDYLDDQIANCLQFAKDKNIKVPKRLIFKDIGESYFFDETWELQSLLDELKKGEIKMVIVDEQLILSDDPHVEEELQAFFDTVKVEVISLAEIPEYCRWGEEYCKLENGEEDSI